MHQRDAKHLIMETSMNVPKSEAGHNHTSSPTNSHVIAIRHTDKGTIRGIADVGRGPSAILKEFPGIQQPGQRASVSPRSRAWQGTEGKQDSVPLVELSGCRRGPLSRPSWKQGSVPREGVLMASPSIPHDRAACPLCDGLPADAYRRHWKHEAKAGVAYGILLQIPPP
jgi:hypothetical protein